MSTTTDRVDTPYGPLAVQALDADTVRLSSPVADHGDDSADAGGREFVTLTIGGQQHRVDVTWRRFGQGEWVPLLDDDGFEYELPQPRAKQAKVLDAMRAVLAGLPADTQAQEQAQEQAQGQGPVLPTMPAVKPVSQWPRGRWMQGGPDSLNVSAYLIGIALGYGWKSEAGEAGLSIEELRYVVDVSHAAQPAPEAAQRVHVAAASALAFLDEVAAAEGLRLRRTGDGVHVQPVD